MGVRADLEPAAVLPAFVHVRVHVADDRVFDLGFRMGELGHRLMSIIW